MRIAQTLFIVLLGSAFMPCLAQAQTERQYLDEVLASTTSKRAKYYRVNEGQEGDLWIGKTYTVDGKLKAEGRYRDASLTIPEGAFTFYHANGKVESHGLYKNGYKSGIWERYDVWGQALAEKVYDPEVLAGIVYTRAEAMPAYPGGDQRAFVRYIRERVSPLSGDRLKADVTTSFVVEKNGELTDVKVVGGASDVFNGQLVDAVKSTSPWQPGADNGRPVRVQMRVPVQF
ncbi:MAG: energy transducer TonB [Flavobacteriales bacterium]|nr:energy transducer TonB [Flavobacteriales bacterium]